MVNRCKSLVIRLMGGGNSPTQTFAYEPSKAGRFGSVLDFFVPLLKGGARRAGDSNSPLPPHRGGHAKRACGLVLEHQKNHKINQIKK